MKKQLLFTIAFLATITFASAQSSTATFLASGSASQTFTVGKQAGDDINDSSIVSFTTGTIDVDPNNSAITNEATLGSNNSFFGIVTPYNETSTSGVFLDQNDTVTGAFTFTLTTDSTTPITKQVTLDMGKRPGVSVSGTISITGYSDTPFSFLTDGTATTSVVGIPQIFGSAVDLVDTNPLTVTITMSELLNVDNTAVSGIFRLENIIVEDSTLSIDDTNLANAINLYPNPVTDSFQLSSIKDVQNVQIYNITGRLLKTFKANANYDISDLATGIYLANIKTQSGSKTVKVVKK